MIGQMRRLFRRPVTWVVLSLGVAALVAGLLLFEPWRAFTHSRVDEPVPVAATEEPGTTPATVEAPPQPRVLAEGAFVSQEHATSGTARVLELTDGSRVLRLEGLATSDGPDVHVWLTDQPPGGPDGSFDDGRYVRLGELKATDGNQNYAIPADARLAGLRSAVIWCDRFDVAFGSAPLSL
jgi:hypothetical protein